MSRKVITKQALRDFRKSKNMTQVEFAEHMGINVWTLRAYEQDKNKAVIPEHYTHDRRFERIATEVENG